MKSKQSFKCKSFFSLNFAVDFNSYFWKVRVVKQFLQPVPSPLTWALLLWRILFSRLIHFLRSPRGRKEQGISKVIYISTIRGLYCGSQIVIVEGLLEEDISEIRCYCNIFDNHNLLIISENSVLNVCSAFLYFERNKGINLPGDEWIPSDMQISCPLTFYGDHTWIIE